MWGDRRFRRKLRTGVLGLVAFAGLIWGAIDIVGVPAANIGRLLWQITAGLMVVISAAALPAWWLHRRRERRRLEDTTP